MRAKEILEKEEVWFRVMDVPDHSSYDKFKEYLGEDIDGIVKTIVMKIKNEFFAFAVPKEHMVDYKKLRSHFKTKKIRMANAEEVLEHSTSPPGACCPFLVDCPLFLDPCVLNLAKIHVGSGSLKHGLEVKTEDLIRITQPKLLDVSVHKDES